MPLPPQSRFRVRMCAAGSPPNPDNGVRSDGDSDSDNDNDKSGDEAYEDGGRCLFSTSSDDPRRSPPSASYSGGFPTPKSKPCSSLESEPDGDGDGGRRPGRPRVQALELCFHDNFDADPRRPISLHSGARRRIDRLSPPPALHRPTPPHHVFEVPDDVVLERTPSPRPAARRLGWTAVAAASLLVVAAALLVAAEVLYRLYVCRAPRCLAAPAAVTTTDARSVLFPLDTIAAAQVVAGASLATPLLDALYGPPGLQDTFDIVARQSPKIVVALQKLSAFDPRLARRLQPNLDIGNYFDDDDSSRDDHPAALAIAHAATRALLAHSHVHHVGFFLGLRWETVIRAPLSFLAWFLRYYEEVFDVAAERAFFDLPADGLPATGGNGTRGPDSTADSPADNAAGDQLTPAVIQVLGVYNSVLQPSSPFAVWTRQLCLPTALACRDNVVDDAAAAAEFADHSDGRAVWAFTHFACDAEFAAATTVDDVSQAAAARYLLAWAQRNRAGREAVRAVRDVGTAYEDELPSYRYYDPYRMADDVLLHNLPHEPDLVALTRHVAEMAVALDDLLAALDVLLAATVPPRNSTTQPPAEAATAPPPRWLQWPWQRQPAASDLASFFDEMKRKATERGLASLREAATALRILRTGPLAAQLRVLSHVAATGAHLCAEHAALHRNVTRLARGKGWRRVETKIELITPHRDDADDYNDDDAPGAESWLYPPGAAPPVFVKEPGVPGGQGAAKTATPLVRINATRLRTVLPRPADQATRLETVIEEELQPRSDSLQEVWRPIELRIRERAERAAQRFRESSERLKREFAGDDVADLPPLPPALEALFQPLFA